MELHQNFCLPGDADLHGALYSAFGWGFNTKAGKGMGASPTNPWVFRLKMISTWSGDWGYHHLRKHTNGESKKAFDHYKFHQFLRQTFFLTRNMFAKNCELLFWTCMFVEFNSFCFSPSGATEKKQPKKIPSGHVQIHSISHWFRLWPVGLATGSTRKGERFGPKCCRKWGEVDGVKMICCISWRYCWWFRNSQQQPPGTVRINPVNNEINYQPQLVSRISFINSMLRWALFKLKSKHNCDIKVASSFDMSKILGCFAGNVASLRYCWWKTSPTTTLFPNGIFTISTDDRRISEPSTVPWNDRVFGGFLLTSLSGDSLAGLPGRLQRNVDEWIWQLSSDQLTLVIYVVQKGDDFPTQSYRDYFISQYKGPFFETTRIQWFMSHAGFDHLRLQNGSERWNAWLQQPQLSGMLWLEISWETWYSCWLTFFFAKRGGKKVPQQK